jgi:hypothetical protein
LDRVGTAARALVGEGYLLPQDVAPLLADSGQRYDQIIMLATGPLPDAVSPAAVQAGRKDPTR